MFNFLPWNGLNQDLNQGAPDDAGQILLDANILYGDPLQLPLEFLLDNEIQDDADHHSDASGNVSDEDDDQANDGLPLVEWSCTQRKKLMPIIAGYPFWRKGFTNKTKTRVRYKCITPRCNAVAYADVLPDIEGGAAEVFQNVSANKLPNHNHSPPVANSYWQKQFSSILHKKTEENFIRPAKTIYLAALHTLPAPVRESIPVFERYKTSIYRMKRKYIPADPKNLDDLVLPPSITTPSGDNILLVDTVANGKRFICFGLVENLKLLTVPGVRAYCDGTFRSCPPLFKQVYGIHVKQGDYGCPIVIAFLEGKSKAIYETLWMLLDKKCIELFGVGLNIGHIILDFESSMVQAIKSSMPRTNISLCLFHWAATLYRNLCDKGLRQAHASNYCRIREYFDCLRSLPLLPCGHLLWGLDALRSFASQIIPTLPDTTKANFERFTHYFERTYFGSVSRQPMYSPYLWLHCNSHERTSNICEAYHHSLNSVCYIKRPSFYYILSIIIDGISDLGQRFTRLRAGESPARHASPVEMHAVNPPKIVSRQKQLLKGRTRLLFPNMVVHLLLLRPYV